MSDVLELHPTTEWSTIAEDEQEEEPIMKNCAEEEEEGELAPTSDDIINNCNNSGFVIESRIPYGFQFKKKPPFYTVDAGKYDKEKVDGYFSAHSSSNEPKTATYLVENFNLVTEISYYSCGAKNRRVFELPRRIMNDIYKKNGGYITAKNIMRLCHEYDLTTYDIIRELIKTIHLRYVAPTTFAVVGAQRTFWDGIFPDNVYRGDIERRVTERMCREYFAR